MGGGGGGTLPLPDALDELLRRPLVVVIPTGTTVDSFLHGTAPTGSFPLLRRGRLQTGVQIPPEDEMAGVVPLGSVVAT
jgi:hypothetical protein